MSQTGFHIKKDDKVMVVAGKDKGKVGKILKIITKKNSVIVEHVNMIKRHTKPGMHGGQGGIIEKEARIHKSNVMLICDKCTAPVRFGKKILEDGTKVRFCKKCGETLDS